MRDSDEQRREPAPVGPEITGGMSSSPDPVADRRPGPFMTCSEFLTWLIQYEIIGSERYRRFISIVFVESPGGAGDLQSLRDAFRASDEIVTLDERRMVVLMRETDYNAAERAIERYEGSCMAPIPIRFAIASYPADGVHAARLLNRARERLGQKQPPGPARGRAGIQHQP